MTFAKRMSGCGSSVRHECLPYHDIFSTFDLLSYIAWSSSQNRNTFEPKLTETLTTATPLLTSSEAIDSKTTADHFLNP